MLFTSSPRQHRPQREARTVQRGRPDKIGLYIFTGLVTLVSLSWLLFSPHGYLAKRNMEQKLENVMAEHRDLRKGNRELKEEIYQLKTDEKYIEELARTKYGLLKKDEKVYTIN